MNFTKSFFVAIDKLYDKRQNPRRLEKSFIDVTTIYDIAYSEQFPEMRLDVNFVPRDDGSAYPVIFEIHGGGFSAGDKKYRRVLCKYYAKKTGAFVVNVNYGVGRENACPLPIQHLVAAANWVVQNAEKYNLDLSRFVATGDSAGGYYAAYLCALQGSDSLQSTLDCSLKAKFSAGVFNCGLFNFEHAMKRRSALYHGICKEFTGLSVNQARQKSLFKLLSVTNHVTESFPPSLVVYSKHDVFCKGQAELLLQKLEECKTPVESIHATRFKDNHDFNLMWNSRVAEDTNRRIVDFINGHFDMAKETTVETV